MRFLSNSLAMVGLMSLGLAVFSGCTNPTPDPTCPSGTGELVVSNDANEDVTVVLSDANGALPSFVVASGASSPTETVPTGTIRVTALGKQTSTAYLNGNYAVKCDRSTAIVIPGSPTFGLFVQTTGNGSGVVTSSPLGISCGSTCSANFAPSTQVTLTVTPGASSSFTGWGGACAGTSPTCVVTLSQAQSVTAEFTALSTPGYPATHAPMPQIYNNGGPVQASPVFTAITFLGDTLASSLEQFVSQVGGSSYWAAAVSEYGVGAGVAANPVRLTTAAPTSIDDNAIQTWLASKLDGTHPEFGTPTSNSLYIIYYPSTTTVTLQGLTSCTDFDGYHSSLTLPSKQEVSYAVIVRCTTSGSLIDELTETTSHEMAEAATDPLPFDHTAYSGVLTNFAVWQTLSGGSENGDMCQSYAESYFMPADLPFKVQRTWSNAAASSGHNPCAPNNAVYFNTAAVVNDSIQYNDAGTVQNAKGVLIPVGQSKTITLQPYSDGPTSGPWTLSAFQDDGGSNLTYSFSQTTVNNGDAVQLTITVKSQDPKYKAELFWIRSSLNGVNHYWPVAVGNGGSVAAGVVTPQSLPGSNIGRARQIIYSRGHATGFQALSQ